MRDSFLLLSRFPFFFACGSGKQQQRSFITKEEEEEEEKQDFPFCVVFWFCYSANSTYLIVERLLKERERERERERKRHEIIKVKEEEIIMTIPRPQKDAMNQTRSKHQT